MQFPFAALEHLQPRHIYEEISFREQYPYLNKNEMARFKKEVYLNGFVFEGSQASEKFKDLHIAELNKDSLITLALVLNQLCEEDNTCLRHPFRRVCLRSKKCLLKWFDLNCHILDSKKHRLTLKFEDI